jgi:hypothetical protein
MPGAPSDRLEAPGPASYHEGMRSPSSSWPQVSDYAVEPESGEEMFDGEVREALPAGPLHSRQHSQVDYVLNAYVAPGYGVDTDLLTRQAAEHNFASDTCIRRNGVDPGTGDRYLEELAVEIKSTQKMGALEKRALVMAARGVRRIFAIPVRGDAAGAEIIAGPVVEWLAAEQRWRIYGNDELIEDPCLYKPLPVRALLDAVAADDAVAQALFDKGNPVLLHQVHARAQEEARTLLDEHAQQEARTMLHLFLQGRGIAVDADAHARIAACRDLAVLRRWATRAAFVTSASQLFDVE